MINIIPFPRHPEVRVTSYSKAQAVVDHASALAALQLPAWVLDDGRLKNRILAMHMDGDTVRVYGDNVHVTEAGVDYTIIVSPGQLKEWGVK